MNNLREIINVLQNVLNKKLSYEEFADKYMTRFLSSKPWDYPMLIDLETHGNRELFQYLDYLNSSADLFNEKLYQENNPHVIGVEEFSRDIEKVLKYLESFVLDHPEFMDRQ